MIWGLYTLKSITEQGSFRLFVVFYEDNSYQHSRRIKNIVKCNAGI